MKNNVTIHILLALAVSTMLFLASCSSKKLDGEGESVIYTPDVDTFINIEVDLPCTINLSHNNSISFTIEAQQNILENLIIYVESNTLYVEVSQALYDHTPIVLNCAMPYFRNISIGDESDVEVTSAFNTTSNIRFDTHGANYINFSNSLSCNDFTLNSSGATLLNMTSLSCARKLELTCDTEGISNFHFTDSVFCSNFIFKSSGSSTLNMSYLSGNQNRDSDYDGELDLQCDGTAIVEIKGQMENAFLKSDGDLVYYGFDFKTKNTSIDITGSANPVQIQVEKQLNINVSGDATISYMGNPTTINITDSIGTLDLQAVN